MSASIWSPGNNPVTQTYRIVNPLDYPFLARADGIVDDTTAIRAAHEYANAIGASVTYAGMQRTAIQANAQIVINTPTDFCGCEIVLLNGIVPDPAFNTHNVLFRVYDEDTPYVTTSIVRADCSLVKGESVPFGVQASGYYRLSANYLIGNRAKTGTQNYEQVFRLDEQGTAQFPLSADLTTSTVVTVYYRANPVKGLIELKNIVFSSEEYNNQICFKIERNQVTIQGLKVKPYEVVPTSGEDVNGTIYISNASDVTIKDLDAPGRLSYNGVNLIGGTYIIQPEGAANLLMDNVRASSYNSNMGSNDIKGVYIKDCILRRIDSHNSGHNIFVFDTVLQERGIGIGWGGGTISAQRLQVYDSPIVSDREDYCGCWFGGNIDVQDCTITGDYYRNWFAVELCSFTRVAVGTGVGSTQETFLPDSITVKNVIRKQPLTSGGNLVVGGVRCYTDKSRADLGKVYAPKKITVDNVTLQGISDNYRFGNYIALREMWPNPSGKTVIQISNSPSYASPLTAFNESGRTLNTGESTAISVNAPTQSQAARMDASILNCDYIVVQCTVTGGNLVIRGGNVQRVKCVSTDATQRQGVEYYGAKFYAPILEGAETLGQAVGYNPNAYFPTAIFNSIILDAFDFSGATLLQGLTIRQGVACTWPLGVTDALALTNWQDLVYYKGEQLPMPVVTPELFKVVGNGIVDDTTNFNAALTFVKTFGLELRCRATTYRCKNLRMDSGTRPWKMTGAGMHLTKFEHLDGSGNFFAGVNGSTVPYELSDFMVDCKFAEYASPGANNAFSLADVSGVRIRRVKAINYKEAGFLLYASLPNTHSDNILIDCVTDALGVGAIGFNIAAMDRSGFERCLALNGNKAGAPGFGIQFKNECNGGWIKDCYAEDWDAGFAAGWDAGLYTKDAIVSGCVAKNCNSGLSGKWVNSKISITVDMLGIGQSATDFTAAAQGNQISVIVKGVANARAAIRFRSGASYNTGIVEVFDGWAAGAKAAIFDSGALENTVELRSTRSAPGTWAVPDLVTFTTAADQNGFSVFGLETYEQVTISGGVATVFNSLVTTVRIDTEGGAASDDLNTLTIAGAKEGKQVTLTSVANARDIVLKHATGNLRLNGSADFTLTHSLDRWTCSYSLSNTAYAETGRGDNAA